MERNNKIIHLLIAMSALFFVLMAYMTYLQLFTSKKIETNPYNRRQWIKEDDTKRGGIYDRNGVVLAQSSKVKEKWDRKYPYGSLYSHVIGYNSEIYGRALLEAQFNDYLLNINQINKIIGLGRNKKGEKVGNDIYLTIDHSLQKLANDLMGAKKGAVVMMDPKTGEILTMLSKPGFNPNNKDLVEKWKELVDSENSPFLPRAMQGLYAPGSTFKVAIACAAVEKGFEDMTFDDKGTVRIDGKNFSNSKGIAYGKINLDKALSVSSNVVFSQLGVKLGENNIKDLMTKTGVGKTIPFDLPVKTSVFPYGMMGKTDMASVAIGQGKMLVTPLQMAMITAGIANDGVIMKPTLVSYVENPKGKTVKSWGKEELYNAFSTETSEKVKDMMVKVVKEGTGKSADVNGVTVAGKTGTAENELTASGQDKAHTWFIGFAPADNPKVAVAVVVEYNGGSGGIVAAPIAGKLIQAYLKEN